MSQKAQFLTLYSLRQNSKIQAASKPKLELKSGLDPLIYGNGPSKSSKGHEACECRL